LYLLGGILLILGAILDIAGGLRGLLDFSTTVPSLGSLVGLLIAIVAGVLALVGMGQVSNPALSVILIILGYLAGGLGGIIVIIGAVIALVADFV
jgi:hypothetical protein